MSCSPVKIIGSGLSTNVTPGSHPMLIANLKSLSGVNVQGDALSQCRTEDSSSVEYPERYEGFNPVIRAPIALNFQPVPGGNSSTCGSDNAEIVEALGESSNDRVSPIASTGSSLEWSKQLIRSSATWFPVTNTTPTSSAIFPSAADLENSSTCKCVETGIYSLESQPLSTFSSEPPAGNVFDPLQSSRSN